MAILNFSDVLKKVGLDPKEVREVDVIAGCIQHV